MKSDETFIQLFLDFLNDKSADGERYEANLKRHPYVIEAEKQGFRFNPARRIDFKPMRLVMVRRLAANVVKDEKGVVLNQRFQHRIVNELNRLKLKTTFIDLGTNKPALGPDGEPIVQEIVALATFEFSEKGVQFGGLPIINGIEFACWYALLLVSRIPEKVRRCTLEDCAKWYNAKKVKKVGFCSTYCADDHNDLMQQRRQHNRRHPDDTLPIIRATKKKKRAPM